MYSNKLFDSKKLKAAMLGAASAAVAEFIIVFLGEAGIEISQEFVLAVLAPFLAYIAAKGAGDIAYNVGNGKAAANPVVATPLSVAPMIAQPSIPPPIDMDIGGASKARTAFKAAQSADWVLTDVSNPAQVEQDYLRRFVAVVDAAKNLWRAVRQTEPPDSLEDSCATGDWSFEARSLLHAKRDLQIQKDMISAIKSNRNLSYLLSGLGYLINGVPWSDIPAGFQQSLILHTPEGRVNWQMEFGQ